jgi:hypothetical protein
MTVTLPGHNLRPEVGPTPLLTQIITLLDQAQTYLPITLPARTRMFRPQTIRTARTPMFHPVMVQGRGQISRPNTRKVIIKHHHLPPVGLMGDPAQRRIMVMTIFRLAALHRERNHPMATILPIRRRATRPNTTTSLLMRMSHRLDGGYVSANVLLAGGIGSQRWSKCC